MEGLFRVRLSSTAGPERSGTPQDRERVAYYKEDEDEFCGRYQRKTGRRRIGWLRRYARSTNDLPMIVLHHHYSMFGFQRIGDLCWQAGDQQARGF